MRNATFRPRRRCGTRLSVRAEGAERDFSSAPKGAERNFPLPRRRHGQSRNATFRPRRRRGTELSKKKPPEPKCGTRLFSFCQSAESDFFTFIFQRKKNCDFRACFFVNQKHKMQKNSACGAQFLPPAALRGRRDRRRPCGADGADDGPAGLDFGI